MFRNEDSGIQKTKVNPEEKGITQGLIRKRFLMSRFLLVLTVACIMLATEAAAGLLPDASTVYGVFMPSAEFSLNRMADSSESLDTGNFLTWESFTDADYQTFGLYLGKCGCTSKDPRLENGALKMEIVRGKTMIEMTYDRSEGRLNLFYPQGTRPEKKSSAENQDEKTALPLLRDIVGIEMPDPGWKEDDRTNEGTGEIHIWYSDITDEQYDRFSMTATGSGCKLESQDVDGTQVTFVIRKDDAVMVFTYDYYTRKATITYSQLSLPVKVSTMDGEAYLFPSIDDVFGVILPSAEFALGRAPDKEKKQGGKIVQSYANFTDYDYEKLSSYMEAKGCIVKNYETKNDVLTIELERKGSAFTFAYDRKEKSAQMIYPVKALVERTTPTPIPTPTDTPKPNQSIVGSGSSSSSKKYMSDSDLKELARFYFGLYVGDKSTISMMDIASDGDKSVVLVVYDGGHTVGILMNRRTGDYLGLKKGR